MIATIFLEFLKKHWLWIWAIVATTLSVFLLARPVPTPIEITKTEYKDRVVTKEVEKVVFRDVVKFKDVVRTRTITKPGGVTIVDRTETKSGESDKSKAVEETKTKENEVTKTTTVTVLPAAPKFLLSVSTNPYSGLYSGSVGFRPFSALPVYVGGGVTKVDSSYKPILTLGVIF
jgi:hypothetical protein